MNTIKIYCDGAARGNPGPAACGFVSMDDGRVIQKQGKYLGVTTNNVAEYEAVILALEWLKERHSAGAELFLDSQLVVRQLTGMYKVKDKNLLALVLKIKTLEKNLGAPVFYNNIEREKNRLADFLVNKILDEQKGRSAL